MSTRFVSIRRNRSRAWSSRRRDRRPRRRLLYLASRELSSLTGSSPGTRARDALEALERVGIERGVLRDVVHNHLEDLGASELLRRQALHARSEEQTSELQSQSNLVCRLLLEKKKKHC